MFGQRRKNLFQVRVILKTDAGQRLSVGVQLFNMLQVRHARGHLPQDAAGAVFQVRTVPAFAQSIEHPVILNGHIPPGERVRPHL